jgi:hypothetical protein
VPTLNPSPRRSLTYRSLPIWLQWLLPFSIAAILVVALVAFVHHQTDDVPAIASVNGKAAVVEQQEDTVIVKQQQAPHLFTFTPGVRPAVAAKQAVDRYMSYEVSHGAMDGPIKSSRCESVGGSASRLVLQCRVTASVVTYPFDVVVEPSARRVTYCQRVAPPVPTMNIPVSRRCT